MALRVPKQNRVAKITRVMLDLTRLTVALPSLENRRPSCVPRLSTIKRFRPQSTAIQRDSESTSATYLSSGSFLVNNPGCHHFLRIPNDPGPRTPDDPGDAIILFGIDA